jgi:predicted transcriptional regulator
MISLKDEYFKRILRGEKPLEFRRAFASSLDEPFLCVIYVSSPIKAVKGTILFDNPINSSIKDLLGLAEDYNYPYIEEIKKYFEGKEKGYALKIKEVKEFKKTISLKELQEVSPNFRPPQSFYCLDKENFIKIRNFINNHES